MNVDKILKIGDEIRVKSEHSSFISTVEDISGEEQFTVSGGIGGILPGEKCMVSCVNERGLYMFETRAEFCGAAILALRAVGEFRKVQRREAFRVRESVEVRARKKAGPVVPTGKWINTYTVDISETGMLLRFPEECAEGQMLELVVHISVLGMNEVLNKLTGKVVRCIPAEHKTFKCLLGIRFEDLPDKARNAIIKLAVLSQRSKLAYKQPKRYQ